MIGRYALLISDSLYAATSTPHPRLLGAFPRFLRVCAFERHVVTPEDVIYKMTFAPAKRFSFTDRRKVANGATKLFGEEIGMNVLPGNLPIEIEAIFELCE